jgi:C-terminal processing protease CtpA/Prc
MKVKWIVTVLLIFLLIYSIFSILSDNLKSEKVHDLNNVKDKEVFQITDTLSPDLMVAEFNYLIEKILEVHPDPKRNLNNTSWNELIVETKSKLEKSLQITEYFVIIQSFVSKIGDAHTYIYPSTIESRLLPLDLQWIGDELIVKESQIKGIKRGDKITHMEGKGINEIMDFMGKIISSENEYWLKQQSKHFIRHEMFLSEILTMKGKHLAITVSNIDGDEKNINFDWKNGVEVNQSSANEKAWYGFELDEENNVGYFYLNECNVTEELEQSVREFFKEVDDHQLDNIIIDLRRNGGGDSRVIDVFIRYLPDKMYKNFGVFTRFSETASTQRGYEQVDGYDYQPPSVVQNSHLRPSFYGDVYILVGNGTFSSANMFATLFHDSRLAKIIGEPTGNAPSGFGDTLEFHLPYTGFYLNISYKEFLRPDSSLDKYNSLNPDILVEMKREDILKQEDGQLKRVKKIINNIN